METRINLEAEALERGREFFIHGGPRPDGPLSGLWAGESIPELIGDLIDRAEVAGWEDAEFINDAFVEGFEEAEAEEAFTFI